MVLKHSASYHLNALAAWKQHESSRCWSRLQLHYIRATFLLTLRHLFGSVTERLEVHCHQTYENAEVKQGKKKHFSPSLGKKWIGLFSYPLNCSLMSAKIRRWFWCMKFPLVFNISQILQRPQVIHTDRPCLLIFMRLLLSKLEDPRVTTGLESVNHDVLLEIWLVLAVL